IAGRQRAGETQSDGFVATLDRGPSRDLVVSRARDGALDRQIGRMEHQLGSRARQPEGDPDRAAKRAGLEVGLEVQVVLRRSYVGREAKAGRAGGGRHRTSGGQVRLPLADGSRAFNAPDGSTQAETFDFHIPARMSCRRRRWYSRLYARSR